MKYTKRLLQEVGELAEAGLNNRQIVESIGISEATFYEWKATKPEFSDILRQKRRSLLRKLSNSLIDSALSGNVTAQIFLAKVKLGWSETAKLELTTQTKAEKQIDMDKLQKELSKMSNEQLLLLATQQEKP